jgi:hypothetical protein
MRHDRNASWTRSRMGVLMLLSSCTSRIVLTIAAAVLIARCGGNDLSGFGSVGTVPTGPECPITGTWTVTDTMTTPSGGLCTNIPKTSTRTVRIEKWGGDLFFWKEDSGGKTLSSTGELIGCTLDVDTRAYQTTTDSNGRSVEIFLAESRTVTFSGGSASGTADVNVDWDRGTCTLNYDTTATRQ